MKDKIEKTVEALLLELPYTLEGHVFQLNKTSGNMWEAMYIRSDRHILLRVEQHSLIKTLAKLHKWALSRVNRENK